MYALLEDINMIKNIVKSKLFLLVTGVLVVTMAAQAVLRPPVRAAGTAVVSVEASSPVQTGADFQANFYVTASGAPVYTVSFSVNFSGITFQSYSPGSSPFNGSNSVANGGSPGSTSIQIAASYVGLVPGGTGKILVGNATLRAGSSAGTGIIAISGVQAYEYQTDPNNETAMSASGQNGSVTIQAPVQPPASCPSGQTGTPPNCTTPSSGSGGGSSSGGGGSTASPNPNNSVAVPSSSDGSASDNPPDIISEAEFMGESDENADTAAPPSDEAEDSESWFSVWNIAAVGGGVVLLLALVVGGRIFMLHRSKAAELTNHVMTPPSPPVTPSAPQPLQPDHTEVGQTVYPDSEHKQE